jgi:undecaprenyl-diphosphatase
MRERDRRVARWLAILIVGAVWLAALLAGGPRAEWNTNLFELLHAQQRGPRVEWALAVTWLGDWLILVPLSIAAAGYLLWCKQRREAWTLLASVMAVRILVAGQKTWIGRARPEVEQWMVEYTASFPSAHAANSLATLLAVAILLPQSRSTSRLFVGIAVACSAVVGLSRIVLGVHWPSDVIGGWAFALLATIPLSVLRREKASSRKTPGTC